MNSLFKSKHTEFHFILVSAHVSTLSSHLTSTKAGNLIVFREEKKKMSLLQRHPINTATGKSNPRAQVAVLP